MSVTAPAPSEALHVGRILREYRLDNNLTEQEVYATLGLSKSWLYSFEATGRCYERNLRKLFQQYPQFKAKVLEAIP